MKLKRACLENKTKTNVKSGVKFDFKSVCIRFTDLEQNFWNSGQEIPRVFSLYDRFHFKFEDFT